MQGPFQSSVRATLALLLVLLSEGAIAQTRTSTEAQTEVIVVTGSRIEQRLRRSVVSTQVKHRSDLVRSGARNVAEALESTPGIRVIPDVTGAVQLQLRGFETDHVLVLIDGQRISGRKNGAIDLTRLGIERVERIEIVKGPASAVYGADALGGVVNIITRRALEPLEGDVRVSYGAAPGDESSGLVTAESFETVGRVAGRETGFDWQGIGAFRRRGPFDLSPESIGTTASELEDFEGELSGGYSGEGFKLRARVEGGTRGTAAVEAGPVRPMGQQAVYDRRQRINTLGVFLSPEFELNEWSHLVVDSSLSFYDETFERIQRITNARTEEVLQDMLTSVNARFIARPDGGEHTLLAGVEALHQTVEATRYPDFGDRLRFSAFAQGDYTVRPDIFLLVGIRLDVDSQFGAFPTPRVAVRFQPTDALSFRGSWGLGFKAPLPRDLGLVFDNPGAGYRVQGNPELDPETASTFTVGFQFEPERSLSLQAEVFRSNINNLIEALPGQIGAPGEPLLFTYGNVEEALIQGLEIGLTVRPLQLIRIVASYELLEALDLGLDRTLPNRAPHRFTGGFGVIVPELNLDIDVRGSWTDERSFFIDTADGTTDRLRAAPYVRLDARVELAVNEMIRVLAGSDNILNAGDARFLTIPPRTFFVGLQSTLP